MGEVGILHILYNFLGGGVVKLGFYIFYIIFLGDGEGRLGFYVFHCISLSWGRGGEG